MKKFNDAEMAKYAKCINTLCAENSITSFWWDTNLLINRDKLSTFDTVIEQIMSCYPKETVLKSDKNFVEEDAACAVKNMKCGWNLGNTLDAHRYRANFDEANSKWNEELKLSGMETETTWRQPLTTREMIHYVKSLGFNAVRVPITWVGHLDAENKIDEEWMARVKQIVDYVIDEGLYCIINVHHDGGEAGWVKACESSFNQFSPRLEKIYRQMCECFADYSERLLFAGVNEMLNGKGSWSDPDEDAMKWVNKWNQLFVDVVRSTGGNNAKRNLVVMSYAGKSSNKALEPFAIPKDESCGHIIFEFHNYDPQSFCWWQNPHNPNPEETPYWDEKKHRDILKKCFEDMMKIAGGFKVPIICGEYGAWPKEIDQ